MIANILGDIAVRDNGNGWTARHAGKTGSCTSSKEGAMDKVLSRIYGEGIFYYRQITLKWPPGKPPIYIYNAVADDGKDEA